ncbi:hypothetical protein [Roseibium sediminis]|uniref:hypothetical protein n=1 Tax=Roseibium sediminis TaxID=1775174 RepID=UPI00123CA313|nr:hypothetical protein [Roseibium sediminis]
MSRQKSNTNRLFDVCYKTPEDGKAGNYATICCGCGTKEDVYVAASVGGTLPVEPVSRKFRNKGWVVGSKANGHTCPECKVREAARPKAAPPPEATSLQRRAILESLEVVFDPEKGFDEGYDDNRVAKELNFPRKWVSDVRELMIGPIPAPKVDHLAEARACLKEVVRLVEASSEACKAEALRASERAGERASEIERKLRETEQHLSACTAEGVS